MNKIPFALGFASQIAVNRIDASRTMSLAVGGLSQFICVGVFNRGTPNKAVPVSYDTLRNVLGAPIHPTEGVHFEHYRQVADALKGGNGYVINVQRKGMIVPAITFLEEVTPSSRALVVDDEKKSSTKSQSQKTEAKESGVDGVNGDSVETMNSKNMNRSLDSVNGSFTFESTPFNFGEEFKLKDKSAFAIRVIDGDKSDNRFITIEKTKRDGEFSLTVRELSSLGVKEVVESFVFSFNLNGVDQSGEPNFIETVLENESKILAVEIGDLSLIPDGWEGASDIALEGGDDGDMTNIEPEAWERAIKAMNDSTISYNAIISAGVYDLTALTQLNKMADDMRVDFFFDISARINPEKTLEAADKQGLEGFYVGARYYFPYKATDPFTGVKAIWGLSGAAFNAKAKGIAKNSIVGGYHYSPAGEERGMIERTGITPLSYANDIDRERFAEAKINLAAPASTGGMCIDDALTTWGGNDDLRFQHVASTVNAFSRQLVRGIAKIKHNPDGITRLALDESITAIADQFVASGALVPPADTAKYGDEPYKYQLNRSDKDLWEVTPWLCVTGVGRRFLIRPVLLP